MTHSTVRLFKLITELAESKEWSHQNQSLLTQPMETLRAGHSGQAKTRDGYTVSWREGETGSGAPCVVIVVTKEGEKPEEFELVDLNDA